MIVILFRHGWVFGVAGGGISAMSPVQLDGYLTGRRVARSAH